MNGIEIGRGHTSQSDSALVGDDAHPDPSLVQTPDGVGGTIEEMELGGRSHIPSAQRLGVDRAIAIEEGPAEASMGCGRH
jgi:hypothetical protein